jgi:hypothetical protein
LGGRAVARSDRDRFGDAAVLQTAIYSRSDGVVAWQSSMAPSGPQSESIEVVSSHTGMAVHPVVLYAVADRLAQPEGRWRPFEWARRTAADASAICSAALFCIGRGEVACTAAPLLSLEVKLLSYNGHTCEFQGNGEWKRDHVLIQKFDAEACELRGATFNAGKAIMSD